jgi:arylsulfatase B
MATPDHTPQGRGYDTSLLYFDAANGYWDNLPEGGSFCPQTGELTDLWKMGGPAHGLNNSRLCSQANQMPTCVYEDELFAEHMVARIAQHNASAGPFFGFISWHNCHAPNEVPAAFLANFSALIPNKGRAMYAAKANYMDTQIGRVVAALKAAGMYESTVIVASADNGGPLGSANNWPRRGGKFSNWEGGTRVNAFASGGLIPPARRGAVERGFAAIDDVYPTFCALAGVDPTDARAAAASLPPVSGHNLWPLISGANATSPRREVYLGDTDTGMQTGNTRLQGLINASSGMKVLVGELWWSSWPPPQSPNGNNTNYNVSVHCSPACLYDVLSDPNEHKNLAGQQPGVLAALLQRMAEVEKTLFNPNRGVRNATVFCKAAAEYGGFVGPFLP